MTNVPLAEMVSSSGLSNEQTARVLRVLEDYLAELERGGRPQPEELLARHPDLADLLKEYLDRLDLLHEAAVRFRVASPPPGTESALGESLGALGDFQLLREIGRGGMGIVYEAEQISLHRRVALKVLPFAATMDPRQLRRFMNEAQAAAGLHHTNIVPVYFVGSERGVHYYAMQFIEGQDLASMMAQLRKQAGQESGVRSQESGVRSQESGCGSSLTPDSCLLTPVLSTERSLRTQEHFRTVARLGIQAAEALDHAHQQGIVHRDVKPANLLVDPEGRLWVTDFGLAQVQSETQLTMTGDLVGTLRYMSPEQALAKRVVVDHRTDIYSLGATLYELLTGEPAFDGRDRQELLRQIALEEPRRPRQWNRAIPQELETIVLKAMERNPVDRYATAQELADDLRNFLEDRPLRAKRPSWRQMAVKWARRHTAAVRAAAVMLVALAVVLCTAGWWLRDRAVRQVETERGVGAMLQESQRLQDERKMPEALARAKQANEILAGGTSTPALKQRVQKRLADLKLITELGEIRISRVLAQRPEALARIDKSYAQAFREFGIDVEALPVEQAAQRIQEGTVAVEIAAILDDWAYVLTQLKPFNKGRWQQLLGVARMADTEPLRSELREALEKGDGQALKALLKKDGMDKLPPASVVALALALQSSGSMGTIVTFSGRTVFVQAGGTMKTIASPGETVALLRQAQRCHPNDFWINYQLASLIREEDSPTPDQPVSPGGPPRNEDAIRFYSIASALRPESPAAYVGLGNALVEAWRSDEALAIYEQALRVKPGHAAAHSGLGRLFHRQGDLDKAIAEYREALRAGPELANAQINICLILKRKGERERAIAEFQQAIGRTPNVSAFHMNLGVLLREAGRLDEAINAFHQAIALAPDDQRIHSNLLSTLVKKLGRDRGIDEYRKAFALHPSATVHYVLATRLRTDPRNRKEAIEEYRKASQLRQDPLSIGVAVEAHYDLGNLFLEATRWDEAIEEYQKAIELHPDFERPYLNLGNAFLHKRQDEKAMVAYQQAIASNPKEAMYHNNLAWVLATTADPKVRDPKKAVEHAIKAVKLESRNGNYWNTLGRAQEENGQVDKAIRAYQEAIYLEPASAGRHKTLALVLATAEEKYRDPKRAVAHARIVTELEPSRNVGWTTLGRVLQANRQEDQALVAFQKAIDLAPNSAHGHNALAWLLATATDHKLRNPERAVASAKKAVDLDKTQAAFWNTLGVAYYRTGEWKDAITALKESMKLSQGGRSVDFFFLAMAHWKLGDKEQARTWYDKGEQWLKQLKPNDPAESARFRAEAAEMLDLKDSNPQPK